MNGTTRRILILDDNSEGMTPLKNFLEQILGYQVELTAETSVIDRLRHEHFDLIILDIMIQTASLNADDVEVNNIHFDGYNWKATGVEFLKRLRSEAFSSGDASGTAPDVPVIVLSAVAEYSVDELLKDAVKPVRHIEKPFDIQEMLAAISAALPEQ